MDPHLTDRVELLLHRSGLHPAQLILEITEGALMKDPTAATESLRRLSRLGVRLAVDDFGTGYSSLAYLQQFPIDVLKIDGSFVEDELASPGWSLAQAIIQISHALGLVPIAEGVETEVQVEALRSFGCNLAQGFHLGRPMDTDAARRLVIEAATAAVRTELAAPRRSRQVRRRASVRPRRRRCTPRGTPRRRRSRRPARRRAPLRCRRRP